ncbi:aminotransferase class IV [Halovenus marina]|uniref:aminotransferase class IV n=1 Tax=Halovenus marina TaxID=3396621 RepID=UPI003F565E98
MTKYFVDGEILPADEATVDVRDRGFRYGDAAFETLRVYGGHPFEWTAHADRLCRTCETLGFADALPALETLRSNLDRTLAANDVSDAYARLSVTRGVQSGKLTPDESVDPTVVIIVKPLSRGGIDGERVWDRPARLMTVETRRIPDSAVPAEAKTHNYLNGILARLELRESAEAYDEAILPSTGGYLTEGATSNLFFVADDRLQTPTTDLPLLPGVTRSVVLDIADELGVSVETGRYEPDALRDADEVFCTNSTWEVRPVSRVDGVDYSTGPVTARLQERFDERVERLYTD